MAINGDGKAPQKKGSFANLPSGAEEIEKGVNGRPGRNLLILGRVRPRLGGYRAVLSWARRPSKVLMRCRFTPGLLDLRDWVLFLAMYATLRLQRNIPPAVVVIPKLGTCIPLRNTPDHYGSANPAYSNMGYDDDSWNG
ncbi:hypothetical protein N7523_001828 [Penicillium sp. IBT 18751x]|nr:hypothetical protein N7523_001828 [Penicillium sp. IBT 18751x]